MWLIIALIGYVLLAIVLLLDKKILQTEVKDPLVYTFYSSVFLLATGGLWLVGVPVLRDAAAWGWAGISGLAFGLGLWTMFAGLKKTEATHLDPFIGAVVTLATFVGARIFLHEQLSDPAGWGLALLVLASFLLTRDGQHSYRGFVWGALSGVAFGIAHITTKMVYEMAPFWTGLVATRLTIGIFGLLLLLFPRVWRSVTKSRFRPLRYATALRRRTFWLVGIDKILGVVGIVLLQIAIARGSVTIVNALAGVQYALLFILVILFSAWQPRWFRERFTTGEIKRETVAVLLILIGLFLVVLP